MPSYSLLQLPQNVWPYRIAYFLDKVEDLDTGTAAFPCVLRVASCACAYRKGLNVTTVMLMLRFVWSRNWLSYNWIVVIIY